MIQILVDLILTVPLQAPKMATALERTLQQVRLHQKKLAQDKLAEYRALNRRQRRDLKAFLATKPIQLFATLVPPMLLMEELSMHYIKASSASYLRGVLLQALRGDSTEHVASFRPVAAFLGERECAFAKGAIRLLTVPDAFPLLSGADRTLTSRNSAFRTLSMAICSTYTMVWVPSQGPPLKIFDLLCRTDESMKGIASELMELDTCLLDDGTKRFLEAFPDVEALASQDCQTTVLSLAYLWLMDINIIERNHSEMQVELRSRMTHKGEVLSVSCRQFMRRLVSDLKSSLRTSAKVMAARADRGPAPKRLARAPLSLGDTTSAKPSGPRGSQVFREFCRQHASGVRESGAAVFRGLGELFQAMRRDDPDAFTELEHAAEAACQRRQHFGTTALASQPVAPEAGRAIDAMAQFALADRVGYIDLQAGDEGRSLPLVVAGRVVPSTVAELHEAILVKKRAVRGENKQRKLSKAQDCNDLIAYSDRLAEATGAGSTAGLRDDDLELHHASAGVSASSPDVLLASVVMDVNEVVKTLFSNAGEAVSGSQTNEANKLRKQSLDAVSKAHGMLRHADCSPLGVLKNTASMKSICRMGQICLCKTEHGMAMYNAAVDIVRVLAKKGHMLKRHLECGNACLCIISRPGVTAADGSRPMSKWYHLGYMNQNSWALGMLRLVADKKVSNSRAAASRGNIALSAFCPEYAQLEALPDKSRKQLWHLVGARSMQHVVSTLDPSWQQAIHVGLMVEGPDIRVPEWRAGDMEIRAMGSAIRFWSGDTGDDASSKRPVHQTEGGHEENVGPATAEVLEASSDSDDGDMAREKPDCHGAILGDPQALAPLGDLELQVMADQGLEDEFESVHQPTCWLSTIACP